MKEKIRYTTAYSLTPLRELKKIAAEKNVEANIELILRSPYGGRNLNQVLKEEAEEIAKKQIEAHPNHPIFNFTLAVAHLPNEEFLRYGKVAMEHGREVVGHVLACYFADYYNAPSNHPTRHQPVRALAWFIKALQLQSQVAINFFLNDTYLSHNKVKGINIFKHPKDDFNHSSLSTVALASVLATKMATQHFAEFEYSNCFKRHLRSIQHHLYDLNNSQGSVIHQLQDESSPAFLAIEKMLLNPFLTINIFNTGYEQTLFSPTEYSTLMLTAEKMLEKILTKAETFKEKNKYREALTTLTYHLFAFFVNSENNELADLYLKKLPLTFSAFNVKDFSSASEATHQKMMYAIFKHLLASHHIYHANIFLQQIKDYKVLDDAFFQFLECSDPSGSDENTYEWQKVFLQKILTQGDHQLPEHFLVQAQKMLDALYSPARTTRVALSSVIKCLENHLAERKNRVQQHPIWFALDEFFHHQGQRREEIVNTLKKILQESEVQSKKECENLIAIFDAILLEAKHYCKGRHIQEVFVEITLQMNTLKWQLKYAGNEEKLKKLIPQPISFEPIFQKIAPPVLNAAIVQTEITPAVAPLEIASLYPQLTFATDKQIIWKPDPETLNANVLTNKERNQLVKELRENCLPPESPKIEVEPKVALSTTATLMSILDAAPPEHLAKPLEPEQITLLPPVSTLSFPAVPEEEPRLAEEVIGQEESLLRVRALA